MQRLLNIFRNHETWRKLVSDFIDLNSGAWSDKTSRWYQVRLRHWCDFAEINDVLPITLDLASLNRFVGYLRSEGYASSTRQNTLTAVNAFFKWLARRRKIKSNPFDSPEYSPPRKERKVQDAIPLAYARKMIREAEKINTVDGKRDAAIMRLLLTTGARREEVARLMLQDIDFVTGLIVVTGKFGHQRQLPLITTTVTAIKIWLETRPLTNDQALFVTLVPSKYGLYHQMRPDALNDLLVKWRDRAGIPEHISVSPHRWRRRFASSFNRSGLPDALQQLLGHQDYATTKQYLEGYSAEELAELVRRYGPDIAGPDELPGKSF